MKLKTRKFKNKLLSKYLRDATRFYLKLLLPENKLANIDISIFGTNKLPADGCCEKLRVNRYVIEIKKDLGFEETMITLAHEMVHVKQYVLKELKTNFSRTGIVDVWLGRRYRNLRYTDQPWEKEATAKEVELYQNYLSECFVTGSLDFNNINTGM